LRATRFDAGGRPLDTPTLSLGESNAGRAEAAIWDGASYVVTSTNMDLTNRSYHLGGIRISPEGAILDHAAFAIAEAPFDLADPAAVSLGDGRWFVAYARLKGEIRMGPSGSGPAS
jgi:hypothetical protein